MDRPLQNKSRQIFYSQHAWVPATVLLLICLLAYGSSLNNPFMQDDYVILFGEKGVSNKTVLAVVKEPLRLFYRPTQLRKN